MVALAANTTQAFAHASGDRHKHTASRPAHAQKASGEGHVGYASFYAQRFSGRKMADGTPMRPESDNAASLSLPLGSKALVTNLRNGRTAVVTIRDRGPYIKGRIIDVSPSTAHMLGMISAGVVKVAVVALDKLPARVKLDAIIAAANTDSISDSVAPRISESIIDDAVRAPETNDGGSNQ
jgi:rare lipoprotein A